MEPHRLVDGPTATMTAKAASLARAAAAGLPVPQGIVLALADASTIDEASLASLWRDGPVIVRSALAIEDGHEHSAAGLGQSIGGVRDIKGYRGAIDAIRASSIATFDARLGARQGDCVIVQRQVTARVRAVLAIEAHGTYVETYDTDDTDAFAGTHDPSYSGPLDRWPSDSTSDLAALAAGVAALLPDATHGIDAEVVLDGEGAAHLVQLRPLTAPLHPGWREFVDAVARAGDSIPSQGSLVLDAEHNPAPLSFAHAALIRRLATLRPGSGGLVPLAGWLYARSRIRDLAAASAHSDAIAGRPGPIAVLGRLGREILPAARARHVRIRDGVAAAHRDELAAWFDEALAAFLAMIDVYLGELIPARAGWAVVAHDLVDPLCLRDRASVSDVLPLAWDLAAPVVAESHAARDAPDPPPFDSDAITDPAIAATLLREWDDHLFALGLAPLRAAYRRVADETGLGALVFELDIDECLAALRGRDMTALARERAALREDAVRLVPPARIVDGRPAGVAPRWLRGIAIGPRFRGPVAQRRDLAALRDDPPSPDAVVCLPALTAVAAVVLRAAGIRAVCCEFGGALSHAALMARELGLSALIGCRGCTTVSDGTLVELDTTTGALRTLGRETEANART